MLKFRIWANFTPMLPKKCFANIGFFQGHPKLRYLFSIFFFNEKKSYLLYFLKYLFLFRLNKTQEELIETKHQLSSAQRVRFINQKKWQVNILWNRFIWCVFGVVLKQIIWPVAWKFTKWNGSLHTIHKFCVLRPFKILQSSSYCTVYGSLCIWLVLIYVNIFYTLTIF